MNCILIDDEPLALEILEGYIAKIEGLEIKASFRNALEALSLIQQSPPDLLLVDIHMPGISGLEFLKTLSNPPLVIITTAYREFALEGYELNAVDYLVKPISFPRFLKAVSKAFYQKGIQLSNEPEAEASNASSEPQFIFIKVDKLMEKVLIDEITYVESLKNYVRIKTHNKEYITYQTLSQMEERLPVSIFLRIHRSYMISLPKVSRYSPTHVEVDGKSIPLGGSYKAIFMDRITQTKLSE